jgi:geranylgeranyl pyrophosphate synthase
MTGRHAGDVAGTPFQAELARFDAALARFVAGDMPGSQHGPQLPETLNRAIVYAVEGPGKRIRPVLVYRAAAALGRGPDAALDHAALALEFIHTYSLIHDDLPAMDDDDLRRGRPTLHRAFDEATAILVGDGLQVQAFSLITSAPGIEAAARLAMIDLLAAASGFAGMVGGQFKDMEATGTQPGVGDLQAMHRMKTGALIRAALGLGALVAGASEAQRMALERFGEHIGLAFQVIDDILDVQSDTATLGKTQGKDAASAKATYVSLLGLPGAREEAQRLLQAALESLDGLGAAAGALRDVARFIIDRDR